MNWRWECQTCAKAKRDYGWGVVFPCNEDKCEPEAFKNTATTSSIPTEQSSSNKIVGVEKMNIITSGCGNCMYCHNGQCYYGGQCYGSPQLRYVDGKWCWMPIGNFKEDKRMKPETLAELMEQVAEKVEKDVAQVCITLVKQYENGDEIARDIAEKYGIDLESIE